MTFKQETRGRPRRKDFETFCAKATAALESNLQEVVVCTRLKGHDSFRYSAPYKDLREAFPQYKISLFSVGKELTLAAVKV